MKIAYLTDQFLPRTSADTEQLVSMAAALSLRPKIEVKLIAPEYAHKNPPTVNDLNDYYHTSGIFILNHIRIPFSFIRGIEKIWYALKAAFLLNKDKPEVVYTRNIPVILAAICFTKLPIFFETYRPWPDQNFVANLFFKWLRKKKQMAGIILHSRYAAKSYLAVGYLEEQLIVAHNAISMEDFLKDNSSKQELRERLGLPDSKQVVTYTGHISPQKGLDRMLKLARHFTNVLFLMVGSEREGVIEKKAKALANVKVIGWQDKIAVFQYLRASDVLYIPTSTKARDQAGNTVLPLKTFIYKASGTAILAPDMEDIREVITHGNTGLLVKPDDIEEEIKGLKSLLSDAEFRSKSGKKAAEEISENTWKDRADKILSFMKSRINA